MKWCVVKIFPLCALILVMASPSVQADIGLCNRFLAFAAKVAGNPTAEMKRRIAYLLETGKIGEEHLARMQASEAPASPFESGQHLSSDIVPHVSAILRLITDKALDWNEVRRFVTDLREKLARSERERAVHDSKTEDVFYPSVLGTAQLGLGSHFAAAYFEFKDSLYAAVTFAAQLGISVIKVPEGKIVHKITNDKWAPLGRMRTFEYRGMPTALAPGGVGRVYLIDLMGKKELWNQTIADTEILISEKPVFRSSPVGWWRRLSAKKETTFAVVASKTEPLQRGEIITLDIDRGRVVKRVTIGNSAVRTAPVAFGWNGKTYAVVGATETESVLRGSAYLVVFDPLTGKIVHKIKVGNSLTSGDPAILERNGTVYAVTCSENFETVAVDLIKGSVVGAVSTFGAGGELSMPLIFEGRQAVYGIMATQSGRMYVMDIDELLKGNGVVKMTMTADAHSQIVAGKFENGVVALGSRQGDIWVVDVETGDMRHLKTGSEAVVKLSAYGWGKNAYLIVGFEYGKIQIMRLYGRPSEDKQK